MADKKFSPMRYSGATEEAAVQGALEIVGVSRDEIEVEILDRSEKGVVVRIKPRSDAAPTPPNEPVAAAASTPEAAPPVEAAPLEEALPIVEDVPELLAQDEDMDEEEAPENDEPEFDEDAGEEEIEAPSLTSTYEISDSSAAEEPADEPLLPAAPIEIDMESAQRAIAKAQEMLDKMGLESHVQVGRATEANTVPIIVEGEDVGILIGKHGATLQSFQYLLNLTLNTSSEGLKAPGEGVRVVVDAGNYRARRQSSLEQTARGAAAKARREGRSIRLEPMPAHERRLVHMFLQTENDVQTQSEGREPMRRIVVSPAGVRPAAGRGGFDRPFGDRDNRGMGGYQRRSNSNGGGDNRGFNRGR